MQKLRSGSKTKREQVFSEIICFNIVKICFAFFLKYFSFEIDTTL